MPGLASSLPGTAAFQAAQDAFVAKMRARGAKVSRLDRDYSSVATRWRQHVERGVVLGRKASAGRGQGYVAYHGFSVETDLGGLEAALAKLSGQFAAATVASFDRRLSSLLFNAWRAWPVRSGYSKGNLDIAWEVSGDVLYVKLISRAPYTFFIMGSPWVRHVRARQMQAGVQIVGDLAQAVKAAGGAL